MNILLAIPVYNEEKYVNKVLSEVRRYASDILVIDDGSTDETPLLLARQPVEVIRHARNRGYGQSMIDAFRWAQCQCDCYDWVITMDCDEQHQPAELPHFFQAIQQAEDYPEVGADVISGTRYVRTDDAEGAPPADRRAINAEMTRLVNQRLGLKLTDTFCGFKAYRVKALRKLTLSETGYAFPMQFWVQAVANGLHIREIPIRLIYNDPNRSFGGPLNDPDQRLKHYKQIFFRELAKFPDRFGGVCSKCVDAAEQAQPSNAVGCGETVRH
jgi:glycosyltransferase involved in cell wall biosynthesis